MLLRSKTLLLGCGACLLALVASASATISPKIRSAPKIRQAVDLSFDAPALPEGGYYYAVMVLESYRHYTRAHPPPCSVSSDMQRTDYGYSIAGKVSLALTQTKSKAGDWCPGGSYEGAIYAVPHPPPCESSYPCSSEPPYERPPCTDPPRCLLTGVVAIPREWAYPDRVPNPRANGAKIVGWFVVRFRSRTQSLAGR